MTSKAVAIIGIGFRFPGDLGDETDFWNALKQKRDLVTSIPPERWAISELQHDKRSEPGRSITYSAGVLSRIDEFDAGFFGISPREAAWMDPQQRLLLELSWEAMENAGIPPSSMSGSNCAVYVGISGLDYGTRGLDDLASLSPHMMTGNTLSIAANRLSYVFNLHGPSLAVDTACSSSLVALHHACQALQTGEAGTALVGGVNLLLHPYPFVGFTKASMLSADGRCKAFDASGSGYVRAEGGAVLLLKPFEQAIAEGDDIQAVILATGINTDGARKAGITIPSRDGQSELMMSVLAKTSLSARDIDFIEAHGTGTAVGDPVETAAIGEVYGKKREKPLPIGSVKANLGHMEPASGMAGIVKAILALKHHALPPQIHLETPNPNIDFLGLNLKPVTEYLELAKKNNRALIAGVNSFGFGGANAHVLLQEYRCSDLATTEPLPASLPPLFLSARSETALKELAGRYADLLHDKSGQDFYDVAHAAVNQRDRMEKRLALHSGSVESTIHLLQQYALDNVSADIFIEDSLPQSGDVAFIYSGNGAQWAGMGRALLTESSRFEEILTEIDIAMRPLTDFSLLEALQSESELARLSNTAVAQPLLFAIQVAVTLLLKEQGVTPSAVAGHSVGEIAAAWAAGALDLDQAICVICARSQVQELTRGTGRMAAAGLSVTAAQEILVELDEEENVEIAGINSPGNVTLAGSLSSLVNIQALLESRGIFFRLLDLDYAFHSKQMDSVKTDLAERLAGLIPSCGKEATFVSTVTGSVLSGITLSANYWWRNVREPVRFADAIHKLTELGCRVFVEIGPHAILQRYIAECLAAANVQGRVLPTLTRQADGWDRLAETALRTHLLVDKPILESYFPVPGQRVRLPNYPWQRERHWHPVTSESLQVTQRQRVHPLLGWRLSDADATWENMLDPESLPWLADHQVSGAIVYPGAAYAEMALAAAREWFVRGGGHFVVEQLDIVAPMVFDGEHARSLRFVLDPRDGRFQIKSRQRLSEDGWTLHAAGRLLEAAGRIATTRIDLPAVPVKEIGQENHYRLATKLGLEYGLAFQGLQKARVSADKLEASLAVPDFVDLKEYLLHPALLDICFQSLVDFFADDIEAGRGIALLPVKMGRIDFYQNEPITCFRANLSRRGIRSVLADFELLDAAGVLVASVSGCRFRAAPLKRNDQHAVSRWQIVPRLQPHPLEGADSVIPAIPDLSQALHLQLANIEISRRQWFKETLPLMEALILSFASEAFQQLSGEETTDWQSVLANPYGRWLANLLNREGLLKQENDRWTVVADTGLPASVELWQTLLCDAPASLPHLTLIGRIGSRLPSLLLGEADANQLLTEQRQSPVAEGLYDNDPAYLGLRHTLEGVLIGLAGGWPASRRLRVLEIAAGLSELPKVLIGSLPEDRFDYVLALPDEAIKTRQEAEYQHHANIFVTMFEDTDLKLVTNECLPGKFDVVILRHTLHRAANPSAVVAHARHWLAAGGLLLLAERYPDWSADFLEGIDATWWHQHPENPDIPVSSLLPPQAWQQALVDTGFVDCETFLEPAAEGIAEGAYLLLAKYSGERDTSLPEMTSASWLLLADETSLSLVSRLCNHLKSRNQRVRVANRVSADQLSDFDHIVHVLGWNDAPDRATVTITGLLEYVQVLTAQADKSPHLWLMTRGGALAAELPASLEPSPTQFALWGFGRVLMNECPQLACTLIDLADNPDAPDMPARLGYELLHPDGINEIVLSAQGRYCLVMQEDSAGDEKQSAASGQPASRFRLDFHVPGQLRNLVWLPETERSLRNNEIEIKTQATGLNFRDVMYVMGLLPDEAVENGFAGASLGLEFSGVVSRVGARVKNLAPGDAVMGFGASCFASHIVTRADAVARMPENWTFEAAATVPTVFFTVYYALKHLANLRPGERVLIHGAAGGVGIAAIQLARYLGAEIYATAGSDEKRDFVRLLGADHVFDSRSLAFADEILVATGGEGVDVVLNSLAGEAMRRSLDVLKPFGRFLELGKRDFFENTPIGLRPFKNNISYFGIDADQLLTGQPKLAARLFRKVMALFHEQILAPLPYRTFVADRIVDAFRVMQQARHIGKIVVSMANAKPILEQPAQPPVAIRFGRESTWLVSGGLSGFGLESARWLASRGVGNLVLLGRRGMDTPGAGEIIATFAAQGVNALALACDITDFSALTRVIKHIRQNLPPLKGVLHAAAVFDDRLIANLDANSIENVLNTKLQGAWHLHQATLDSALDHFVVYSSVTTTIGNPGQANYVAANVGLEGLIALRRHMELPATCIAWGPIGDSGYLTRNESVRDSLAQRLGKPPLTTAEALAQLDHAFAARHGFTIPANFDWHTLSRLLPSADNSRFTVLNRNQQGTAQKGEATNIHDLITGKTPEEITTIVRNLVAREVAQILAIAPERIEPGRSLHALGMDSLMAVELALGLEQRFGIQLPVMMLNDAPTVDNVTARIVGKLAGGKEIAEPAQTSIVAAGLGHQHGEEIALLDVEELAEDARKLAKSGTRLIV